MSFYSSVARHIAGAVAVLAVVVLVVVLATSDDDGAGIGASTPDASPTGSAGQEPTASPTPTKDTQSTREPRARSEITIVVLNGTARSGLASRTKERLVAAGYTVVRIGNSEEPVDQTTVYFRPGALPEAELVLDDFPDLIRSEKDDGSRVGTDSLITIILGDDYRT
ncbi:MAG: LytR C-terminal domain-containing protein [Actinomycetota bacterium]